MKDTYLKQMISYITMADEGSPVHNELMALFEKRDNELVEKIEKYFRGFSSVPSDPKFGVPLLVRTIKDRVLDLIKQ